MLKTILSSVREYKKTTFLTIFYGGIEALFEIVIPIWMASLIDKGIEAGNMKQVWFYIALLAVFAGMQVLTGVAASYKRGGGLCGICHQFAPRHVQKCADVFFCQHRQIFDSIHCDAPDH